MTRHTLGDEAWADIERGTLPGPGGRVLVRGGTRLARAAADAVVRAGAPVVVYWPGGGELDWYEGHCAAAVWEQRRSSYTASPPAPTAKRMVWTGGLWSDDRGSVLVLTGHC